ncbi:MAG: RloB family protein [Clostridia bacterium]
MGIKEQDKRRKRAIRQTNPIWLIVCEGRNKTEINYLSHFNKREGKVRLIVKPSEDTDPRRMVERAKNIAKAQSIGQNLNDRIICLIDLDIDDNRAKLIQLLKIKYSKINIFVSNPCFEIWFLLHFTRHPNRENKSRNVKKQLEGYVPNYTESMDILQKCTQIQTNYSIAIKNAQDLRKEYSHKEITLHTKYANPYTDIDLLISALIEKNGPPQINCD